MDLSDDDSVVEIPNPDIKRRKLKHDSSNTLLPTTESVLSQAAGKTTETVLSQAAGKTTESVLSQAAGKTTETVLSQAAGKTTESVLSM